MKRILLILITLFTLSTVYSAPVIKAVANGYWGNVNTWDLNRLPQIGDTIVIGSGKVVTVNNDQNIAGFAYVKIWGKLSFLGNNSTLKLGPTSVIWVYANARIEGGGSASQKIRIGNNTVFDGNDAPVTGPQVATINGFTPAGELPLPVKFVGFTLSKKNNDALIQWATSEEQNANVYEVEKSTDGRTWAVIAYVTAAGNTTSLTNYSYTDRNITSKTAYYRIKQVDMDGRFSYTPVRSIKSDNENANVKIASMQQSKVLLQFPQEIKGNVTVRFISTNGQIAGQQTISNPVGQIILNTNALKGSYVVSVNGTDITAAKQVIL